MDVLNRDKPENVLTVAEWQMEIFKMDPTNAQARVDAVWRTILAERVFGERHPDIQELQSKFSEILAEYYRQRDGESASLKPDIGHLSSTSAA